MLRKRLTTAAVMIPVVVGCVLWLPQGYFAVFFALIALAAAWEWGGFMRLAAVTPRVVYSAIVAALLLSAWIYVAADMHNVILVMVCAMLWWLCALVLVILYPRYETVRKNRLFGALAGILVIVPSWLALVVLRGSSTQGAYLVLFLLAMIAVADSCAYFGGKKWGTNKLAPQVSPGKTWEGVFSALLGVAIFSLLCAWLLALSNAGWDSVMLFVGVSVLTAIFSVLGDLSESLYKRQVGLKDSGSILPGHGGVLDRIDSLTAAAPVFLICLWLLFW